MEGILKLRASDTTSLETRGEANKKYGSQDFDAWVKRILSKIDCSLVLDVCCGTGNQLTHYIRMPSITDIYGVDISQDSLEIARQRCEHLLSVNKKLTLKCCKMEEMFNYKEIDRQYDLISCFYGLYYAEDVDAIVEKMIRHLNYKGVLLVVGPYGKNNASLFEIIREHCTIPELVIKSSTTFMQEDLMSKLVSLPGITIDTETLINPITYPSYQAVMDYWQASTFYFPQYHSSIQQELQKHFKNNDVFVVEKHIMAIIASKL